MERRNKMENQNNEAYEGIGERAAVYRMSCKYLRNKEYRDLINDLIRAERESERAGDLENKAEENSHTKLIERRCEK